MSIKSFLKILIGVQYEQQDAFGVGAPNDAYARYFTGQSYLKPLTVPGQCPVFLANVTFEPGCRNNWHIHHATKGGGQLLICTAGEGWYQEEGKEAVSLTPGTVITIPADVKHWHGAKADSWLATLPWRFPARIPATNGASRLPTRNTPNSNKDFDSKEAQARWGLRFTAL